MGKCPHHTGQVGMDFGRFLRKVDGLHKISVLYIYIK